MAREIVIIGASGHGKVVADIIKKLGDKVCCFLDDDTSKDGVVGKISDCIKYNDKEFIIAIGNNSMRRKIAETYSDLVYYTAIHPSAVISDDVVIEKGTAVMANAVINAGAKVGKHSIINTAAVIEHDNVIGNYTHISPNATLCGTVIVGDNVHIGAGTVVRNNLSITDSVVIGCGSCVVKDIEKNGTYAGVPAKEL